MVYYYITITGSVSFSYPMDLCYYTLRNYFYIDMDPPHPMSFSQQNPFDGDSPYSFKDLFARVYCEATMSRKPRVWCNPDPNHELYSLNKVIRQNVHRLLIFASCVASILKFPSFSNQYQFVPTGNK